ncbi:MULTISPECIES: late competence protein ComER [Heyndrickxia]|uniref:late competence protein ComER n=1 Tax=Heyndrickxia TaxID=2837504 RepID=UPI0007171F24|nr:late competence protein ComER [Heyndrickxia oleronia]GIN38571.1 pyrroline-5-carboxylate reductase [Heyndrickxia oleronia]
MNIGFIGTGNMGSILVEGFIEGKAVNPSNIYITNRTKVKAEALQQKFPSIHVCDEASKVIENCHLVFICVKPLDIYPLLEKYKNELTTEKCLVSITSPISVDQLEQLLPCSCIRAIPSITNRALSGVSLLTFGKNCDSYWERKLKELFSFISTPIDIDQNITRVASDIVSCGPAFFSYLTQRFIDGAVAETKIDQTTATILAGEMLIGLGELLKKGYYTLPTLQEKVCVKGGITGEGIGVLEDGIGDVFEKLFQATHSKFNEDLEIVTKQFS